MTGWNGKRICSALSLTALMFSTIAIPCQPASSKQSSIVVHVENAINGTKPIYDLAYVRRRVLQCWFPSKCIYKPCTIGFGLDLAGNAIEPRTLLSTGAIFADEAAIRAILKAKLTPARLADARMIFHFTALFHPGSASVDVVLEDDAKLPPVAFVNTGITGQKLDRAERLMVEANNRGVDFLLNGETDKAKAEFEAALKTNPAYLPAVHNLKLVPDR